MLKRVFFIKKKICLWLLSIIWLPFSYLHNFYIIRWKKNYKNVKLSTWHYPPFSTIPKDYSPRQNVHIFVWNYFCPLLIIVMLLYLHLHVIALYFFLCSETSNQNIIQRHEKFTSFLYPIHIWRRVTRKHILYYVHR